MHPTDERALLLSRRHFFGRDMLSPRQLSRRRDGNPILVKAPHQRVPTIAVIINHASGSARGIACRS